MKSKLQQQTLSETREAFGLRRLQRRFSARHSFRQSGAKATALQTLREFKTVAWIALILSLSAMVCLGETQKAATNSRALPASATLSPGQIVTNLLLIDLKHGPVTSEQAADWKQNLKQLTQSNAAALPAIREFLGKNLDLNFEVAGNAKVLGHSSLRLALLDAVNNIGESEGIGILIHTLETTADPAELATVLKFLEQSEPGKHHAAALNAAREVLNVASSDQWDGRDVAPLFEILKTYGGARVVADLEKHANTWFVYTPITLAQLPEGAGVASLIRLARNADGSIKRNEFYQRALAQVATQYPAVDALVELTQTNRIKTVAWPGITAAITGARLDFAKPLLEMRTTDTATTPQHEPMGNQNYVELPPPANLTANQLGDRIRLIDRLLEATSNPSAIDALEGARITLATRLESAKR